MNSKITQIFFFFFGFEVEFVFFIRATVVVVVVYDFVCAICHQVICECADKFINDIFKQKNILMLWHLNIKQRETYVSRSFHIDLINSTLKKMCQTKPQTDDQRPKLRTNANPWCHSTLSEFVFFIFQKNLNLWFMIDSKLTPFLQLFSCTLLGFIWKYVTWNFTIYAKLESVKLMMGMIETEIDLC